MAIDNIASGAILTAYNCTVWGKDTDGKEYKIGIVDSLTVSKNIQTQRAMVIGDIMPASVDPQSLTASISLSGFIAPKNKISNEARYGSGHTTLTSLCPDDDLINVLEVKKIPELILKDKGGKDLCKAEWCIVSSYQIQAQGQSYIKANVQLEAITMNLGSDYTDGTFGMNSK